MLKVILTGLAGACGTLLRFWLAGVVARRYGEAFPWGTLVVNVVGCFLAGALFHLLQERALAGSTAQAVMLVGFLGGFTTFSAYGLQTFMLLRDGAFWFAALNVVVSNLLGLCIVWTGYTLAHRLV